MSICVLSVGLPGWLSGREAEYMETLSDEQVTKDVISTLKQFLRRQNRELPTLRRMIRYVRATRSAASRDGSRARCGCANLNHVPINYNTPTGPRLCKIVGIADYTTADSAKSPNHFRFSRFFATHDALVMVYCVDVSINNCRRHTICIASVAATCCW